MQSHLLFTIFSVCDVSAYTSRCHTSPCRCQVLTTSPFFGGQGQGRRDPQASMLAELGLAYSGLEGFDEAASVGQAQLGQHMRRPQGSESAHETAGKKGYLQNK